MWMLPDREVGRSKYVAVADHIESLIADGRLAPGQRLPPQRTLAKLLGIDFTTVSRGYLEAARRGLIASHVGRGTYVNDAVRDGRSRSTYQASAVNLSLNVPTPMAVSRAESELSASLVELTAADRLKGLLSYQLTPGTWDHRIAGSAWLETRGLRREPGNVVLCAGAQHALTAVLTSVCPPGSTILCEEMTYPAFRALAEQLHLKVEGVQMDHDGICPGALEDALRRGRGDVLYCIPTLQNPTTAIIPLERRHQIADLAREYDLTIIEDDVYGSLCRAPAPIATFAFDRTIYISSLSKAVAPGLRIAYVCAPAGKATRKLEAAVTATMWMAPPLMAEIASMWITSGVAERLLTLNREEADRRQAIAKASLPPTSWRTKGAGFHGWLELPKTWTGSEFATRALQLGIAISPSELFAVGKAAPPGVRLSLCGAEDEEGLLGALHSLRSLLEDGPTVHRAIM